VDRECIRQMAVRPDRLKGSMKARFNGRGMFYSYQKGMPSSLSQIFVVMVAAAILFSSGLVAAAEKPGKSEELLLDTYHRNVSKMETSDFGLPLFLESFERDHTVHVDVYGIFDYSLSRVAEAVTVPANWCDIVSLHPNVKACTYREKADAWLLTFYLGRKEYQPPGDTRPVFCQYQNVAQQPGYLDITLHAERGPFATKDHRMRFEALALDKNRTFAHVSYTYSDSAALRLATRIYFATLGRDKVGFTVTATGDNGETVYIGGPRGAIERSAIRYYFAIQSFMNTLYAPQEQRFGVRIVDWYDRTIRYRRQLSDWNKQDYLASKAAEHDNQMRLQEQIGTEFH